MEPTISLPSPQPPQPLFRTPGGLLNDKENMPKSGANRKRSHSAPNSHTFLKTLPTPPLHHNANESYVANSCDIPVEVPNEGSTTQNNNKLAGHLI
uniref:Uncharacterized protein n=1 Tax=Heterorhabditis bacteriophora TaxID=37862 RepID=A0A1I7XBT3_HETBA